MYNCDCLIHPFQNDSGTSQNQRMMDELLAGTAQIDSRSLADLLDYFVQLSRHINYYDSSLNVSDWQPFFKNSIPFALASIINNKTGELENSLALYNTLFKRKPTATGLQLNAYFIFYQFIFKINIWHLAIKGSGLPIENNLEILIKDKLQQPVKLFISYTNAAIKWYRIKKIDFIKLYNNPVWNLDITDLYAIDNSFKSGTNKKIKQINNLNQKFTDLASLFINAAKIISSEAGNNLEKSFLPLKEELQKKHPPHLGLLFTFLNMFRYLQQDLNGYTRKHLDFFYKDVLQIKSRESVADKAHIIFEIQKQLQKYLVKKGILVKDGKDKNKQEILFSVDEEIVVNKTEVADIRTLFLNNEEALTQTYVEGVYIAPNATMADGVDKDFKDEDPKNFAAVGSKLSKYSDPETLIIKPYPNARIGFILASPVLYLKEGTRTIDISVACELKDSICEGLGAGILAAAKNCCNENSATTTTAVNPYPNFLISQKVFGEVQKMVVKKHVYLNETILRQILSLGFDKDFVGKIRDHFLVVNSVIKPCYCDEKKYQTESSFLWDDWDAFINTLLTDVDRRKILDDIIKPQSIFNVLFSGEKNWVESSTVSVTLGNLDASNKFMLKITAVLNSDKPAVTFYDKVKLKEDYITEKPLVKIELNDHIKLVWPIAPLAPGENKPGCCEQEAGCCLLRKEVQPLQLISYYHFFRNVDIIHKIGTDNTIVTDVTRIDVKVCGLKNFIVQNDESVQDVNGPVYPFGTRPKVIDFNIINPIPLTPPINLIGPNFYIGSNEVFCKKWTDVRINFNWKDKPSDFSRYYEAYIKGGLDKNKFEINVAYLNNGTWLPEGTNRRLFDLSLHTTPPPVYVPLCSSSNFEQVLVINPGLIPGHLFTVGPNELSKYTVDSTQGFIRINLQKQDFLHKDYAYILARQMNAEALVPKGVEGAVYYDPATGGLIVFDSNTVKTAITDTFTVAVRVRDDVNVPTTGVKDLGNKAGDGNKIDVAEADAIRDIVNSPDLAHLLRKNLTGDVDTVVSKLAGITADIISGSNYQAIIPNEPWTPILSSISIDYTATALFQDIDLIHLYPYAGTYKNGELKLKPTLLPTFCDEGTLFLGLKNLIPGENVNILYQLAEATSDSESEKENVYWHYLDRNEWKALRKGFELLDDATENLTTSGIIKFALPANMSKDNTVMPAGLHWIKASIAKNSKATAEITGIHPQAIEVTFTNDPANDKLRLADPLPGGSLSKLSTADANVKSVQQPYNTFDGRLAEMEGQFYVRVSELLRHKGRAIQLFDYERVILENFPQLFKVKCINHSFALNANLYKNDFPYAPGYVILAVIPDLFKLVAGNSFEPKVPVSLIEKIEAYVRKRVSPFVRFHAMNPRYEKINFCLRVKLLPGRDENYYRDKIKQDLKELLAPWAVGKYDKLTFGQCVFRSEIIRFLENTDYVDFINDLRMGKAGETPTAIFSKICPDTPRSILVAGEIEVCIEPPECEQWAKCYDDQNRQAEIECCTTALIPVADYCNTNNEMNG